MERNAELEQPNSKLPFHVSFHPCLFVIQALSLSHMKKHMASSLAFVNALVGLCRQEAQ